MTRPPAATHGQQLVTLRAISCVTDYNSPIATLAVFLERISALGYALANPRWFRSLKWTALLQSELTYTLPYYQSRRRPASLLITVSS
eukprot:scaffold57519_cov41-Prasinocladus_malaysianus.AAC.1